VRTFDKLAFGKWWVPEEVIRNGLETREHSTIPIHTTATPNPIGKMEIELKNTARLVARSCSHVVAIN